MQDCRILIGGDFVAKSPNTISIDEELLKLLGRCDIKICNFEAPIQTNNKPVPKSGPSIYQSPAAPSFLENLGFNLITLANNHIMDFGPSACFETINSFERANVIGAGKPSDAFGIQSIVVNGKKFGFLALCQYENGIVESANINVECGVAWINSLDIQDIIKKGKQENDYLFVLPHAGLEDVDAPLPEWRVIYHKFIDWGASAIIASHPHAPQGWELYRDAPIFYSLGNFYFDVLSGTNYWNKGLLVELVVGKKIDFTIYNTTFLDGHLQLDKSSDILIHNKLINSYLSDENRYFGYIDKCCEELYQFYQYGVLRGVGGVSFWGMKWKLKIRLFALMLIKNKNIPTFLNTLRCETHRWAISRYLSKKI